MADQKPKKLPPKARTTSGRTTGPVKKPSPPARRTVPADEEPTAKTGAAKADPPAPDATDGIDKKADAAKAAKAAEDAPTTDATTADATKADAPKAGKRPPKTKITRSTAGGPSASGRYTPPTQHLDELPSPTWVPVLMFTMFALGMLVIFLNYVELLPGATTNWYLLVGLGLILGGIITATQYR